MELFRCSNATCRARSVQRDWTWGRVRRCAGHATGRGEAPVRRDPAVGSSTSVAPEDAHQCLAQCGAGDRRQVGTAPGDVLVRPHQQGAVVGGVALAPPRMVAVDHGAAVAYRQRFERHAEFARHLGGGGDPGRRRLAHQQHEAVRCDQIKRRDDRALAADPGVRQPVAGARGRHIVQAHRVALRRGRAVRNHGAVVIPEADFQVVGLELRAVHQHHVGQAGAPRQPFVVVGQQGAKVGAAFHRIAGNDAHRRAGQLRVGKCEQRPAHVALRHRAALALVGVEQAVAGVALDHHGEFPGQVVRVLDAGIEPQPGRGRVPVRGVAGQKHPAEAVALGEQTLPGPRRAAQQFDRQVGNFQEFANPRDQGRVVEFLRVAVAHRTVQQPLAAGAVPGRADLAQRAAAPEGGVALGVDEDRGGEFVVVHVLRQVGPEVDRDHFLEHFGALHARADDRPDGAPGIGRHHIARAHQGLLTAGAVADHGARPGVVLRQFGKFGVEQHASGVHRVATPAQEGFEAHLRIHQELAERAAGLVFRRQAAAPEGLHLVEGLAVDVAGAAEAGHPADLRDIAAGHRAFAQFILEPVLAHHFEGAAVEGARLGHRRRLAVAFDQQAFDAEAGKKQVSRQAAAATADDEDRYRDFTHAARLPKLGFIIFKIAGRPGKYTRTPRLTGSTARHTGRRGVRGDVPATQARRATTEAREPRRPSSRRQRRQRFR